MRAQYICANGEDKVSVAIFVNILQTNHNWIYITIILFLGYFLTKMTYMWACGVKTN